MITTLRPFVSPRYTFHAFVSLAAVLIALGAATSARADTLMVDFTSLGGSLQSGFISQSLTDATYNLSGGMSVFVDLPAVPNSGFQQIATRTSTPVLSSGSSFIPNGTDIASLQRDFFVRGDNTNNGGFLTITLSGVAAGTYPFELWFSDVTIGGNIVPQLVEVSTNSGSTFSTIGTPAADGLQSSPFAFTYTANGTNNVVIRVTEANSFNQLRLNGFALQAQALSSSAPEPGTLAFLALGGTLVLARRRRK